MMRNAVLAAVGVLLLPAAASAQGKDELWEVTTQMSVPGMPAGMGAMTQQVCQDRDPAKQAAGPDMDKCKITERSQSGNRMTMTVVCPEGRAVIEHTYNAARTEYKGTMRMTSKDGDMTMNTTGRRIGSCDAQQARRERESQQAKVQGMLDQQQQQARAAHEQEIGRCAEAVQTMDMAKLGIYGQREQQPELYKAITADPSRKAVNAACNARRAEFCKRYQTEEGFLLAKGDERAAAMCGLQAEQVRAGLCPGAAQKESLAFLGRHCLAEAKPLAERHCAGRSFTALRAAGGKGDRYADFCVAYLSNAKLATAAPARPAEERGTPSPADAVQQGISEGVNRLRGLFGR